VAIFPGCRHSDTLEEIIYDQLKDGQIDPLPPFDISRNNAGNTERSNDLQPLEEDRNAERADVEEKALPLPGDTGTPPPSPPPNTVFDNSGHPSKAPSGRTNDPSVNGNTTLPADNTNDDEGGGGMGGTGTQGESAAPDSSALTSKQVVDAYGRTVDIPENVNTVAGVGSLAVLTLILGGADRLTAADSDLLGSGMAVSAFAGIGRAAPLWSGSGGGPLSPDSFERLLELHPEVVVEESGRGTLTDAQVARLEESGVGYLVLPATTSLDGLCAAAETMGAVLGDQSAEHGANAHARAAQYVAWLKSAALTAAHAVGSNSVYTLYLADWDDDARYRLFNENFTTLSGKGGAVVHSAAMDSGKALSSYLALANVMNTASRYGISAKKLYFTPLISAYRRMEISGPRADGMATAGQKLLEQNGSSLGKPDFKILLVANARTAEKIKASALWNVYPHIDSGNGSFNSDGFLDEEGNLVRTQISGQYDIVVNPRGLSSWTDGGCESVLESVWAAWRFHGALSENDVRRHIREFYSLFYRLDLSAAALDAILEGAP
jgi:hypothetical protein